MCRLGIVRQRGQWVGGVGVGQGPDLGEAEAFGHFPHEAHVQVYTRQVHAGIGRLADADNQGPVGCWGKGGANHDEERRRENV